MLKKQTVWLLTMLSLMVVLSVYYMQPPADDDFAFIFEEAGEESDSVGTLSEQMSDTPEVEDSEDETPDQEDSEEGSEEANESSSISTNDELFTVIRMELAQSRSQRLEQLETIVASSSATNEEKNSAYEEMQNIDRVATKELIVEETLKAENGYSDVLVRTNENNVIVTVKADELSETEANQIMRMVYDEFGSMNVEVKFQPTT